jgi:hypothetical protein
MNNRTQRRNVIHYKAGARRACMLELIGKERLNGVKNAR